MVLPYHCSKCGLGFHIEIDKAEHESKCAGPYNPEPNEPGYME